MKFPSASKLQMAMACKASSFLPYVSEPRGEVGSSADRGTKLHACIDALFNEGMDAAVRLAKELDILSDFLAIDQSLFSQGLDDIQTEVAFEYDLFASDHRIYGRNGHDKFLYGNRIRGVADLVGTSGSVLTVIDWKTGNGDTEPVQSNWQLIVAALVFRSFGGSRNAIGKIINTTTKVVDQCEYTEEFLDECEKKLKLFAENYSPEKVKDQYSTGEHCKYCRSWIFCPAQKTAIERAANLENDLKWLQQPVTDEIALSAIESLRSLDELSKKAQKAIRGYIEIIGGRLVRPDGRAYVVAVDPGKFKKEKTQ